MIGGDTSHGAQALVDKQSYRDAMARLAAAVNIITTTGPGGTRGFTASAVCSVTDTPPTLLVCLNRNSDSNQALKENGILCVNTLAAGHEELSPVFAGMTGLEGEERFNHGRWTTLETGAAVLEDALVSFDCTIAQSVEVGTHTVFICEVQAVKTNPAPGLLYFARNYHAIG
jgi:flavin reductase